VRHYEPPEVAWLLPELEVGVELEPRPLELELPELEDDEFEELEPEEVEPDEVEPVEVEPDEVEPVEVAERTLPRPLSLSATAWRIPSRCALLITLIVRSGTRNSLHVSSRQPLS